MILKDLLDKVDKESMKIIKLKFLIELNLQRTGGPMHDVEYQGNPILVDKQALMLIVEY